MTVKDYLSQNFTIRRIISARKTKIEDLKDMRMSLGGGFGIKVQTSLKTDRLGEITADLHEMIERYEEDVRRLIDLEQEISRAVNTLERDEYKLIMFERYVNLKRWEDVAEDNHYSLSAVNKIHRFALKAIERTLKSEGKSFSAARG